jgi:hypothetical protein
MLKVAKTLELKDAQETESAAILGEEHPELKKKKGNPCESLIWGNKKNSKFVTCSFRKRVIEIAENLGIGKDKMEGANWLMAVMALETGGTFYPSIGTFIKKGHGDGDKGGYVGLIQFGYWAALDIKIKRSELAKMTALKQLDCVEKYFKLPQFKEKLKTLTDLYLAVLYQGACGHGHEKNYVVFDSESSNSTNKKVYWDNPTFHNETDEIKKNSKGTIYERNGKKKGKTYIWEVKLAIHGWYSKGTVKKNTCKKDASTCEFGSGVGNQTNGDGVLEEMKKLADKHIPYSQQGVRNSLSEKGMEKLDCSEFVGIYLNKLGVMPNYTNIDTGIMTTESSFRKAIGSQNIDLVSGSTKSDFKPQRGDIFVWRDSDGHTGIVYEYDAKADVVTILEAIGKRGASGESKQVKNGGYSGKNCSRTAKYGRLDGAMYGHRGWKGYFRPINYTKKL